MDCDTTGIEPDFALVKFKKLAGGGYFKIINRAVPEALRVLGYGRTPDQGDHRLCRRPWHARRAPGVDHAALTAKGLHRRRRSPTSRAAWQAPSTSSSPSTTGPSARTFCKETLGSGRELADPTFDLLVHLGFSKAESRPPTSTVRRDDARRRAGSEVRASAGLRLRQSRAAGSASVPSRSKATSA